MLAFHIGGKDAGYVRVSNIQDHGDGWFSADVEVVVGAFRGIYSADFNSWAFSNFQGDLENLYRTVSGLAVFTSHEKQLEVMLTCDVTGHIEVRGEAMDSAGTGNKLVFRINIDQTYVPAIINDLQSTLKRYPPHLPNDSL